MSYAKALTDLSNHSLAKITALEKSMRLLSIDWRTGLCLSWKGVIAFTYLSLSTVLKVENQGRDSKCDCILLLCQYLYCCLRFVVNGMFYVCTKHNREKKKRFVISQAFLLRILVVLSLSPLILGGQRSAGWINISPPS